MVNVNYREPVFGNAALYFTKHCLMNLT